MVHWFESSCYHLKSGRISLYHRCISSLKPASVRPCSPAFLVSCTMPAFTFDCLRFVCGLSALLRGDVKSTGVCLRLREQCLRSTKTLVARLAHVLLLRSVVGNMEVNTIAPKQPELIGNAARNGETHEGNVDLWQALDVLAGIPAEGKSSVCLICMKYRIIILIIIIISLDKILSSYIANTSRTHACTDVRTRILAHTRAHAHPHTRPSLFAVSVRPTMTPSWLGAPFPTLARQWPIGDTLK